MLLVKRHIGLGDQLKIVPRLQGNTRKVADLPVLIRVLGVKFKVFGQVRGEVRPTRTVGQDNIDVGIKEERIEACAPLAVGVLEEDLVLHIFRKVKQRCGVVLEGVVCRRAGHLGLGADVPLFGSFGINGVFGALEEGDGGVGVAFAPAQGPLARFGAVFFIPDPGVEFVDEALSLSLFVRLRNMVVGEITVEGEAILLPHRPGVEFVAALAVLLAVAFTLYGAGVAAQEKVRFEGLLLEILHVKAEVVVLPGTQAGNQQKDRGETSHSRSSPTLAMLSIVKTASSSLRFLILPKIMMLLYPFCRSLVVSRSEGRLTPSPKSLVSR